jgi:hypothetical protein
MPHYLNNCKNRDHAKLYGPGAFYDLDTTGTQVQAWANARMRPGDWCVVANEPQTGLIRFAWYKYTESKLDEDENQWRVRVLCGVFEKEESMSKAAAFANKYYRPFFNKNGHFLQRSII